MIEPQKVTIGPCDLWLGDCREVLHLLGAVAVIVTDPPYGISYASGMGGKFKDVSIAQDETVEARDWAISQFPGIPALVFGSWKRPRPSGTRHLIVWDKGDHVGMGDLATPWRPNTEEIYVIGSGFKGHRGSSVLRVNAPSPNFTPEILRHHPTEKPVQLMRELVGKCPMGLVLDPFMGSGSTGVACVELGRPFVGIELDPKYFEVAVKRITHAVEQSKQRLFEPEPEPQPDQPGLGLDASA